MLGEKLKELFARFSKKSHIDEREVKALVKELQRIFIAADIDIELVLKITKEIEKEALNKEQMKRLTLREHVLQVVYDKLVEMLGESYKPSLEKKKILLVGLYGVGKTTTAGKIANWYKKRGLSVGLIGADLSRPGAVEQVEQLAKQVGAEFYRIEKIEDLKKVMQEVKEDIVIVDSAGRDAFDEELKKELEEIKEIVKPDEVYLVLSSDIGQNAKEHIEQFSKIGITAIVRTRIDGSGRGGAALTASYISGAKVAFIGTGEKMDDLELYDSKSYVARMLGIPDIKGLVEKIKEIQKEELEMPTKLTAEAILQQIKMAKRMGPFDKLAGMLGLGRKERDASEEKIKKIEALISSMTKKEREELELVKKSRSRQERIAKGAGVDVHDVQSFLREFDKMKKIMKKFKNDRRFRKQVEQMMGKGGFGNFGI